jgi:hypothetical protein
VEGRRREGASKMEVAAERGGCVGGGLALMVTPISYVELGLGFGERGLVDSGDRGGRGGDGKNGCGWW